MFTLLGVIGGVAKRVTADSISAGHPARRREQELNANLLGCMVQTIERDDVPWAASFVGPGYAQLGNQLVQSLARSALGEPLGPAATLP